MTPDRGQRSKVNLTLPCGQYTALRLGVALDASDRLGEAEAAYRKVLELSPLRELARAYLALNLLAQGRNNEGLANAKREPSEGLRLWALAIIQHTAGRRAQSNAALQELIANCQTDAAYQIAEVYGARGAVDLAFDWLERAYVQRDGGSRIRRQVSFSLTARRSAVGCLPAQDGPRGLGRSALPRTGAVARSVAIDRDVRYRRRACTAAVGRSATIKSERERLDRRRSQYDPQQPLAVRDSSHST